jgi:hypothetical protein
VWDGVATLGELTPDVGPEGVEEAGSDHAGTVTRADDGVTPKIAWIYLMVQYVGQPAGSIV